MNIEQVTDLLKQLNTLANTVSRVRIDMMTPEQKEAELKHIRQYAYKDHEAGLDTDAKGIEPDPRVCVLGGIND